MSLGYSRVIDAYHYDKVRFPHSPHITQGLIGAGESPMESL